MYDESTGLQGNTLPTSTEDRAQFPKPGINLKTTQNVYMGEKRVQASIDSTQSQSCPPLERLCKGRRHPGGQDPCFQG